MIFDSRGLQSGSFTRKRRDPFWLASLKWTPTWITPDLVELTVKTWRPYYAQPLTIDEAIDRIRSVGRLWKALS